MWLQKAIDLEASGKLEEAELYIFEFFDNLFEQGKFDEADKALAGISASTLSEKLFCAILGSTLLARRLLPSRAALLIVRRLSPEVRPYLE